MIRQEIRQTNEVTIAWFTPAHVRIDDNGHKQNISAIANDIATPANKIQIATLLLAMAGSVKEARRMIANAEELRHIAWDVIPEVEPI